MQKWYSKQVPKGEWGLVITRPFVELDTNHRVGKILFSKIWAIVSDYCQTGQQQKVDPFPERARKYFGTKQRNKRENFFWTLEIIWLIWSKSLWRNHCCILKTANLPRMKKAKAHNKWRKCYSCAHLYFVSLLKFAVHEWSLVVEQCMNTADNFTSRHFSSARTLKWNNFKTVTHKYSPGPMQARIFEKYR